MPVFTLSRDEVWDCVSLLFVEVADGTLQDHLDHVILQTQTASQGEFVLESAEQTICSYCNYPPL